MKRIVFGIMLTLLMVSMLTLTFNIKPVKAGTIIVPDDYSTIQEAINHANVGDTIFVRAGTYSAIVIDKSLTLEGENKYTTIIEGGTEQHYAGSGICIHANDVRINNFTIQHARGPPIRVCGDLGVRYANITISDNIMMGCGEGVRLINTTGNVITGNVIRDNGGGIAFDWASDNIVHNNTLLNVDGGGIQGGYPSYNNTFSENTIINNPAVIMNNIFEDNRFFHNNFLHGGVALTSGSNQWNDGYPFGGNYWTDYTGVDANGDGIGDIPYVIDADNQDRYPLMHPWSSLPVHNINTGLGYATIQEAINAPETLNDHAIFVEEGTYYEHVVVNKALSFFGEDKDRTVIDGSGTGKVVFITVDNVTINGFNIRNSGYDVYDGGVWLASSNNHVSNNHISDNSWGIGIDHATANIIDGNILDGSEHSYGSWGGGIFLLASNGNFISNNMISCREDNGIFLQGSENYIIGNTLSNQFHSGINVGASNNFIHHNNFLETAYQVRASTGTFNIWDDGYPSGGNYWTDYEERYPNATEIDDSGIWDTPYVINENDQDNYPLMNLFTEVHDVAIVNVVPSATEVYVGQVVNITVTVQNQGSFTETFNVTCKYELEGAKHVIGNVTVSNLAPQTSTYVNFTWTTTDVTVHTISAYATPVQSETDTTDNTLTSLTTVKVKILGDVNGDDIVDGQDVVLVIESIPSYPGHPFWNPQADLNDDVIIDGIDVVITLINLGKTT